MKKLVLAVTVILITVFLAVLYAMGVFKSEENIRFSSLPVTAFSEIKAEFTHHAADGYFPFTGAAAIDIDSGGVMELFVSGSHNQSSAILAYKNNKLVDITSEAGLSINEAAFGVVAFDINNDKHTDLVVAQQNGVWLYTNMEGQFVASKIVTPFQERSFPTSIALSDINHDGLVDMYISYFVELKHFRAATFNDPSHAKHNVMLLNKGSGEFVDITEKTGTAGVQNTFISTFIDLNNDGYQDLVLANNTGPVEIFKNLGELNFEPINIESGLGYWMGIGVGDIDEDGDQDLYLSNIGSSIPNSLLRGDLTESQNLSLEWLVLENLGDFNFKNITNDVQLDGYGFAWGGVFEDLNLDGKQDLLVAQNYINWPGHVVNKLPAKAFIQSRNADKHSFLQADNLGLANSYYGQSAVIIDLNNDAKPDVVWLNMDGPIRAFINNSDSGFIKVKVPDNVDYLGATLWLETESGSSYAKQIVAGVGMGTDQTPNVFFGLGVDNEATAMHVRFNDGREKVIKNIRPNSTISLP